MRRTVTVLQDDIDNGKPRDGANCAVARAARRDLADLGDLRPAVTGDALRLWDGRELVMDGALPPAAAQFVGQFDLRYPVEPFKFEVELTAPARRVLYGWEPED